MIKYLAKKRELCEVKNEVTNSPTILGPWDTSLAPPPPIHMCAHWLGWVFCPFEILSTDSCAPASSTQHGLFPRHKNLLRNIIWAECRSVLRVTPAGSQAVPDSGCEGHPRIAARHPAVDSEPRRTLSVHLQRPSEPLGFMFFRQVSWVALRHPPPPASGLCTSWRPPTHTARPLSS